MPDETTDLQKLEKLEMLEGAGAPAQSLNDVLSGKRYTALVAWLAEFMILSQLSNVNFMVYAGLEPQVASCGGQKFNQTFGSREGCNFIRTNHSCEVELSMQFRSVNVEFEYYCDKNKIIKDSISYQMIGIILGSIIMGQLSDLFGRKRCMLICLAGCSLLGFASSFANNLVTLTLIRAGLLFFNGGQIAVLLVFLVENIAQKNRMWVSTLVSWSPNNALFAVIAFLCGDWRTLSRVTAILILPAIVICLIVQESPRWLIQKGRIDEARKSIERIFRFNGVAKVSDEAVLGVIAKERKAFTQQPGKHNYFLHNLFMWKSLALHTLIFSYSYISISIINYGLFFNMGKVPGSIYMNNVYIGIFRWIINISLGMLDFKFKWFTRKLMHTSSLGAIVLATVVINLMNYFGLSGEYVGLMRIATLSISVMTNQIYIVNNVSSNELFPTPIRNVAFSFLQVMNRLGVVLAPQLFYLGDWLPPFVTMFVLGTVDMIWFQWALPETKGRPLTDCMPPDSDRFFK